MWLSNKNTARHYHLFCRGVPLALAWGTGTSVRFDGIESINKNTIIVMVCTDFL